MPEGVPDRNKQNGGSNDRGSSERTNWAQVANYAQLGFVFPAATVVGWLIGAGLDKWLHTSWLYLVGLILGIVAGFVELIRMVAKSN